MNSKISLFIITLLLQTSGFAITIPVSQNQWATPKDSNALYLNFQNANFLWNNEFFNGVAEGYTLIGYFARPQLQYHFTPHLKIDAGIHLLKYSGLTQFTQKIPSYVVTYSRNDFELIMGTLKGTVNHGLPDQILFTERYFTDNLESGIQYRVNKQRWFFDSWLDWQNFIFTDDNEQEELKAGLSSQVKPIKNTKWELSVLAGGVIGHRGGQIDTTNALMLTAMNYFTAVKVNKHLSFKYLHTISFESFYMGYSDNSPTVESLYQNGSGFLNQLRFSFEHNFIQFGYWNSNKYLSLMGNPMYQSFSAKGNGFHEKQREFFTAQICYSKNIHQGINLNVMADTYLDLKTNHLDYSMGLTLIINSNFFLKRFK